LLGLSVLTAGGLPPNPPMLLIVVRKNAARMCKVRGISDSVTHCRATVVGTVLNDF